MVHVLQAAQHLEGAADQETGSSLTGFRNSKKAQRTVSTLTVFPSVLERRWHRVKSKELVSFVLHHVLAHGCGSNGAVPPEKSEEELCTSFSGKSW